MIPTIKLYLNIRTFDSDEMSPIIIWITCERGSFILPTHILIKPSCWDNQSRTIIKMSNRLKVNAYLTYIKRNVEEQLMQWSEDGYFHDMSSIEIRNKLVKSISDEYKKLCRSIKIKCYK